jgi:hypothetical protein
LDRIGCRLWPSGKELRDAYVPASITEFEGDDNNLYKLWNRMSCGSYFPSHDRTARGHGFLHPKQLMPLA